MADIAPTSSNVESFGDTGVVVVTWALLTAANAAGTRIEMPGSSDRCVQIDGTFDTATVVLQGSNDGTTYFTLTDPQGNAISKTAAALEQVSELTRFIRPSTSGGGGSQSVNVRLLLKRAR